MAEWIAARGALPRAIPELYGGFAGFHPPLFHLMGALALKLFGSGALRHLNVFVSGLLVLWIALDRHAPVDRDARRWAILLCVGNGWLALHAVRLYVEQLTALLAVGAVVLALRTWREPRARWTVPLGITVGLALLAKHSSVALVALLAGLAALALARRERATAGAFARALGLALLLAAPFFVRNAILYGSPLYPMFAPDRDPLLFELNRRAFTPAPLEFYRETIARTGWPVGLVVVGACGLAAWRRRGSLELGLIGAAAALFLAGPLQPLLDTRHLLPVIAVVAVLGAIVLARELAERPAGRATVTVALLLAAGRAVAPMPDYRATLDEPAPLRQAFEAARQQVPEGETILSLWTYDTWYYARRPATWPIPWAQPDRPVGMFTTSDCDSVLLAFRRHRLRYALVPRVTGSESFDGVNYPASLVGCVQSLLVSRRMALVWMSPTLALIHVPAADSTVR